MGELHWQRGMVAEDFSIRTTHCGPVGSGDRYRFVVDASICKTAYVCGNVAINE